MLNDIIVLKKGKKPNSISNEPFDSCLPYVDIKSFETGIVDKYTNGENCVKCSNEDLLIVCDGSRSGLVGKAIDGYVGSTLARIDILNSSIDKDYLYYFLQSKYVILNKNVKGTGTPHLKQDLLKSFEIYLPNLQTQKRIVTQIEESLTQLDSAVETLKKTKQQLEVYRQSVLKEAFDISTVNQVALYELCSNIVDCPHSTPKWTKEGKLCLRTTNFKRGYLDLSEKNYVSNETFDLRNKRLIPLPGDIVYSREGAILGIACIIPDNTYVCLGQRMMLLRTSEYLNNRFLMHYLNSPKVNSYIKEMTGGSASPHVNVKDIKALQIPVLPIYQQKQIIKTIDSKLSVCDSIGQTVTQLLQQAEVLRQSILKQAFSLH